jgi:diphosphomevalonate decarboxylase
MKGYARACANIALAKYWGKCDEALNLPAVPSISVTLDALVTETTVARDASLAGDEVTLDGALQEGAAGRKVTALLDLVRARAGVSPDDPARFARVVSTNHFPAASGLASSASGFAALAAAGARAYGAELPLHELSALARRGSASAARSLFGGFVELPAGVPGDGSLAARMLHPSDWWDVRVVIALVTRAPKAVASRDGMRETARTSPYWSAWLACAPGYAHAVKEAVAARDLEAVGAAMEASTFAMHASAWAAVPAVRYVRGVTLDVLDRVEALRREGTGAWATMDAGPHVKVLCAGGDAERVAVALRDATGVIDVRVARPGEGVAVT